MTTQVSPARCLRRTRHPAQDGSREYDPAVIPGPARGTTYEPVGGRGPVAEASGSRARRARVVIGSLLALLLTVEAVLAAPSLGSAVQALSRPDLGWLGLAVLAAAASMGMFARVRRRLLRAAGVPVSWADSVTAVYVANALHATLPGGAAFSTAYTFRRLRSWGASGPVATWGLVAGGMLSTVALAVVGLAGALTASSDRAGVLQLALEVIGVLALVFGVRLLRRHPQWLTATGRRGLMLVNRLLRRPPETGADRLEELPEQLRAVRPTGRDWAAAGLFSLLNWLFDVACLGACAAAVGVHGLGLPLLLVAYTAGMAANSLSLLPGGIGVVDAAMVLTLVAGGVPAASALPAVVLYRLISFAGVVLVGWVMYAVLQLTE